MKGAVSRESFERRLRAVALAGVACSGSRTVLAAELVAANGITGAGTRPDCRGRAWAELGFSAAEDEAVAWTQLGAALRLSSWLEVEGLLPIGSSIVERDDSVDGGSAGDDGFPAWLGNPYFGANLLALREPDRRWRVGAGFTLPVSGVEDYASDVALLPLRAAGGQDPHLWHPGGASLVGRGRLELDAGEVTVSFDLAAIVTLRVRDEDAFLPERTTALFVQPAVELASYVSPDTLVGARLPAVWGTFQDFALSVVPFLRQELEFTFAEAQLTLNMVGNDGLIAGDDGPIWGAQLGIGARF